MPVDSKHESVICCEPQWRAVRDVLAGPAVIKSEERRKVYLPRLPGHRIVTIPGVGVIDDFGLHRLSAQQSADLYELIIERHRRSSIVITSNRGVDEWLGLFDDPILGNSALDRLAHGAYQIVIEGSSYRAKKAPKVLDAG